MTRERVGVLGPDSIAIELDELDGVRIAVRTISKSGSTVTVTIGVEDARYLADHLHRLATKIEKKETK